MNTIHSLENIGGNLITNQYYKWNDKNTMIDLKEEDYNIEITDSNTIKLTFPLGLNGIVSNIHSFKKNNKINLKNVIDIINEYYNNEITKEEKDILNEQTDEDLSIYSLRIDLLDYSNLCFFQGMEEYQGVYNILLGS
tara:strand:+ start:220 stop:633 length:414 start_codon:yes stop_codon:yes gene_type:complete